mgnify:FL=1
MKFKFLLLIGVVFLLSSCSGDSEVKEEVIEEVSAPVQEETEQLTIGEDGWVEYDHKEYTVFAPQDWEMDVAGRSNTTFILF